MNIITRVFIRPLYNQRLKSLNGYLYTVELEQPMVTQSKKLKVTEQEGPMIAALV